MKTIEEIYEPLILFLDTINVTEITAEGDNQYDLLFNGKTDSQFLEELDKILTTVREELIDLPKLNLKKSLSLIDSILNDLCVHLISKESVEIDPDVIEYLINPFLVKVFDALHKHKHTWYRKPIDLLGSDHNLPLQWNENINKLVDVFYQLSHELKTGDNKPLIKTSNKNLENFLVSNFVNKSGKSLSCQTVNTDLKESRSDKRPTDNRIGINYLPM